MGKSAVQEGGHLKQDCQHHQQAVQWAAMSREHSEPANLIHMVSVQQLGQGNNYTLS